MSLFGKDPEYLEVASAEFLPDGNKLYIVVSDSDCNLHVLQYDPEGNHQPSPQSKKREKKNFALESRKNPNLQARSPTDFVLAIRPQILQR